jgi:hypothetical protein
MRGPLWVKSAGLSTRWGMSASRPIATESVRRDNGHHVPQESQSQFSRALTRVRQGDSLAVDYRRL